MGAPLIVVVGLGNPYRGDDGVGPLVATQAAREAGLSTSPLPVPADLTELIDRWDGADAAVVVDAIRSGRPPGTLQVREVGGAGSASMPASSSHGLGLREVVHLARALGEAPERVVVVAIEGVDFRPGDRLSPAVAAAIPAAVRAVADVIKALGADPRKRHPADVSGEPEEQRVRIGGIEYERGVEGRPHGEHV